MIKRKLEEYRLSRVFHDQRCVFIIYDADLKRYLCYNDISNNKDERLIMFDDKKEANKFIEENNG